MNWIRENKFLAGFIGVMTLGIVGLGFLLMQAMGNYEAVHTTYMQKVQQLQTLQNLEPYPNQTNLDRYQDQKAVLAGVVSGLEQKLAQVQFPMDPTMTPAKFQVKLQGVVSDEIAKAKGYNIQLPDKFALGFDKYLSAPPVQAAAAPLDRELKAMQFVFDELLDGPGVESIASNPPVNRTPLPEELGGKTPTSLLVKSPVEITFVADMLKLRKVLNDLSQTNKQFYIVRVLQIKNKGDKPLLKADALKNRTDKAGNLVYVLGTEKLEITLSLEIVNFNPPPDK